MTDAVKDSDIDDDRMVLRTVYLPPELDEKLRVHAFRSKTTKGEVIRRAIAAALTAEASFGEDERPASKSSSPGKGAKISASSGSQTKSSAVRSAGKAASNTTGRIGASTSSRSNASTKR